MNLHEIVDIIFSDEEFEINTTVNAHKIHISGDLGYIDLFTIDNEWVESPTITSKETLLGVIQQYVGITNETIREMALDMPSQDAKRTRAIALIEKYYGKGSVNEPQKMVKHVFYVDGVKHIKFIYEEYFVVFYSSLHTPMYASPTKQLELQIYHNHYPTERTMFNLNIMRFQK